MFVGPFLSETTVVGCNLAHPKMTQRNTLPMVPQPTTRIITNGNTVCLNRTQHPLETKPNHLVTEKGRVTSSEKPEQTKPIAQVFELAYRGEDKRTHDSQHNNGATHASSNYCLKITLGLRHGLTKGQRPIGEDDRLAGAISHGVQNPPCTMRTRLTMNTAG